MPEDHSSWDRNDLLRPRKHERFEQYLDSSFRWRNSSTVSSSHHVQRDFSRWGPGDLRRPSGHSKQGGRHQLVEETDHGHVSYRSSARMFEDDNYRPSASRGDWRYNRNPRDGRVSFSLKDSKYHTWEVNKRSPKAFGRLRDTKIDCSPVDERPYSASDSHTSMSKLSVSPNSTQQNIEVCAPVKLLTGNHDQKLANQRQSPPSYPHSDYVSLNEQPYMGDKGDNKVCSPRRKCHDVSDDERLADSSSLRFSNSLADLEMTWGQIHSKDQLDNKVHGVNGLHIAKQSGKENSPGETDWKYPIWAHSGFSHISCSKSFGTVDSSEQKTEFLPKIAAVTESASGDAAACFTSSCLTEEMKSRKKPRLGWGEGLAKYEKKKVDVNVSEDGTTMLVNSSREAYSLVDKSPTMVTASDFSSPATPSSVACNSSPGMGDKASAMAAKAISDGGNLCSQPSPVLIYQFERFPLNIEDIEDIPMENLSCLLNELLRTDDSGPGDSFSVQLNAMNKVLAWKGAILRALEVTESEIDLLESKRRVLKLEAGSFGTHQIEPNSYLCVSNENVPGELGALCVAERLEGAVNEALLAKLPVDVSGEGVERSQDIVDIYSIKTTTSSTDVDMSGFANNSDSVDLSSGGGGCMAYEQDVSMILAANRKSACEASEVFNKFLSRQFSSLDDSIFSCICQENVKPHIKQKVAVRRQLMRVKEKLLVRQFKAFQFSWKRYRDQLAIAKFNAKSQKKCESNLCIKNDALQKLPQSVCLKFLSHAPGIDSPAPTTEFLDFAGKLLLNIQCKPCRDILRMPAMILDEKEKLISRFISSNRLVEDPCAAEKERTMINPWTSEEREIFLNKLAVYGKDFRKIASHLEQKTTADCINFYYKNHKSECFEKIKKKFANGKEGKCTYMLAPQKRWKREMGATSLDILGAVSMIAANARKVSSTRQMSSKKITLAGCSSSRSLQHSDNSSEGYFYNFDLPVKQSVSADGLTGGDGSLSSRPVSSIDPEEKCMKYPKFVHNLKMCQVSEANSNDEDDTCSEESCDQTGPVHWTDEERSAFMQGFSLYGKNFTMISQCVGSRSQDQCRVFFSKVRKCLGSELILPRFGNISTSASFDNGHDGGGSEVENPCALEASSVMCNEDLCAKMDTKSPFNMNHDGADHSSSVKLKTDIDGSEQDKGSACLHLKDGTELVDTSASLNRDCAGLVSGIGREFIDVNTVENQSQVAQKSKSNLLLSSSTEEGVLASAVVSPWPLSSNATILANLIMESYAERSKKCSGSVAQSENRTGDPPIQAEAASSSSFCLPEYLHHVPIEVCMEDPIRVHLQQEKPRSHSEIVSPTPVAVQVVERGNLRSKSSNGYLSFGEKNRFYGHVNHGSNSLQDVHVSDMDALQIPWSSFMPDLSGQKGSKSDVIVTTQCTGDGFSLNRCSSLTSSCSTAKQLRLSHKEGRSGHNRRRSSSLSDTDRPYKSRVVKLFGTILTSHEHGKMQHPHEGIRPSSTATDQHDLQNVPITSYGFWDGKRIQTGLTSSQHPEAFAKHVESCASDVQLSSSREIQPDGFCEILNFETGSVQSHQR